MTDHLDLRGWEWRHPESTKATLGGKIIPSGEAADLSDLYAWRGPPRQAAIWLELKMVGRYPTPGQKSFVEAQRALGIPAWVLYDDELHYLDELLGQAIAHFTHIPTFETPTPR